jgi:hypothetical protein
MTLKYIKFLHKCVKVEPVKYLCINMGKQKRYFICP